MQHFPLKQQILPSIPCLPHIALKWKVGQAPLEPSAPGTVPGHLGITRHPSVFAEMCVCDMAVRKERRLETLLLGKEREEGLSNGTKGTNSRYPASTLPLPEEPGRATQECSPGHDLMMSTSTAARG